VYLLAGPGPGPGPGPGRPVRGGAARLRACHHLPNDAGLLAEEVDPAAGELPGNFPQAFSHIGLVNPAWAISEPGRRQAASPGGLPAPSRPFRQRGGVPGTTLLPHKPGLPGVMRVTWYRSAATVGRRREGYLPLVLLTGLTGGIAMDSVAAASVSLTASPAVMRPVTIPATLLSVMPSVVAGRGGVAPAVGSCDAGST